LAFNRLILRTVQFGQCKPASAFGSEQFSILSNEEHRVTTFIKQTQLINQYSAIVYRALAEDTVQQTPGCRNSLQRVQHSERSRPGQFDLVSTKHDAYKDNLQQK